MSSRVYRYFVAPLLSAVWSVLFLLLVLWLFSRWGWLE